MERNIKKSSYQKLKEENRRLLNDLYNIIMKEDKALFVSYKLRFMANDGMWFGDSDKRESKFTGIMKKIESK